MTATDSDSSTPSSEYKRRIRAQCVDQHYRQQRQQQGAGGLAVRGPPSHPVRSSTFRGGGEDVRARWNRDDPHRENPVGEHSRSGLSRSNSSLELDRGGSAGLDPVPPPSSAAVVLCRDYGSVNSLDQADCFSTILRNYRQNSEDLANDGGGLAGKLSGSRGRDRYGSHSGAPSFADTSAQASATVESSKISNGFLQPTDDLASAAPTAAAQSPQLKSKSQKVKDRKSRSESGGAGGSLFRKLRGVKSDPYSGGAEPGAKVQQDGTSSGSSSDASPKLEDRIRRKAFSHYDCQSIGVGVTEVIRRRSASGGSDPSPLKRTNTATGASAASGGLRGAGTAAVDLAGSSNTDDVAPDVGDGKNNDLVQSCAYFRNEIGGEDERTVAFSRHVAERQRAAGRHYLKDLVRSAACNGVAVLDCSPTSLGVPEPTLLLCNNYILEYVDQGAFYYRRFFYDYGEQFLCPRPQSVRHSA